MCFVPRCWQKNRKNSRWLQVSISGEQIDKEEESLKDVQDELVNLVNRILKVEILQFDIKDILLVF